MHFETCYYRGIEYAIEKRLACFDPGAQGEHKIQRGFQPTPTYSNHWIDNDQFRSAIETFTINEKREIDCYRQQASSLLPFKNT